MLVELGKSIQPSSNYIETEKRHINPLAIYYFDFISIKLENSAVEDGQIYIQLHSRDQIDKPGNSKEHRK